MKICLPKFKPRSETSYLERYHLIIPERKFWPHWAGRVHTRLYSQRIKAGLQAAFAVNRLLL